MAHPRYEQVMKMEPAQFKRRTGVYPETFKAMHSELRTWQANKKRSGRPPARTLGEQLLLTLEFWREYRTFFHLGEDWDIHESTAQRTVERVEDALINSGKFSLPSQKSLLETHTEWTAVLVDVTEVPCEKPKKTTGLV